MELSRLSMLSRRAFSALAGTTVLGLALGGSVSSQALPGSGGPGPVPTGPPPGPPDADGLRHRVALDRYSLLVDGRRLALWSGEMHPFRLPSPSLWRDVLQKMRAYGHNAVTVRLAWNQHSPTPGAYDFTGVRDLDLFLRTAAESRLYVVLHPGPYIGADVDAGGLPGWLTAAGGRARTTDPAYLRHADEWLTRVNAIAARHQFTRGTGTLLLYRADAPRRADLAHLHEKIRADGIDVPLLHADTPLAWGEGSAPGTPPRRGGPISRTSRTGSRCTTSARRSAAPPGAGCPPRPTPRPPTTPPRRSTRPAGRRPSSPRSTSSGTSCGTSPTSPGSRRRRRSGPRTPASRCGT